MRLRDKAVKLFSSPRQVIAIVILAIISVQFVCGVFYAMSKQVSIVDGGKTIVLTSYAKNIAEVLAKEGVRLGKDDEVTPKLSEALVDGQVIKVGRAKNITLVNGKETFEKLTAKETVSEALKQFRIKLTKGVDLNVDQNNKITKGMVIQVTYNTEEVVSEEKPIPHKTIKKPTDRLGDGQTKIAQKGRDGSIIKSYKVVYVNGDQVSKELVSENKTAPVDEVIEYGRSMSNQRVAWRTGTIVSRGGELRYRAVLTVSASAYDLSYASCGKNPGQRGYGVTASGMKAQYGCVSVDPRVIPLGSRLYIEAPDGSWTYGNAVAADTGGAIKGNRIDLFMNTRSECLSFGRRTATVYILE